MSRIRSRGNRDTELALARLLRANHITGWRRHFQIRGRAVLPRGQKNQAAQQRRPTNQSADGPAVRPYLSRKTGFRVQAGAARTVRGRLFLAWLSQARDQAGQQSRILAAQTGGKQKTGCAGNADVAARALARHSNLGM
jgi:hypothetical protein